jgi:beta-lactamase class D
MRPTWTTALAALAAIATWTGPASARTVCTIVVEAASARTVLEEGDCATRVTPASTFKVALAVMGFDAGILKGPHDPVLPFKDGYVDWRKEWKQPTDPVRWLKYSVVWYSQQITHALGAEKLHRYTLAFGYGNADVAGDPGKDNGLDRSWIGSSLQVSPREQAAFLAKLVSGTLPVSARAMDETRAIVETRPAGNWTVHGKTGAALPRRADGSFDRAHGRGWYVGWAEKDGAGKEGADKDGETYVFARLIQDEAENKVPAGFRARDSFLADWPAMAEGF